MPTSNQKVVGSACADMIRRRAKIAAHESMRLAVGRRRAHHGRRAPAAIGEGEVSTMAAHALVAACGLPVTIGG